MFFILGFWAFFFLFFPLFFFFLFLPPSSLFFFFFSLFPFFFFFFGCLLRGIFSVSEDVPLVATLFILGGAYQDPDPRIFRRITLLSYVQVDLGAIGGKVGVILTLSGRA